MAGDLFVFPLPLLTFLLALVACILVMRLETGVRATRLYLMAFFGIVACGSFLVALRFGYGVTAFIPIQRVLPLFVGPVLYLAFAGLALAEDRFRTAQWAHLGAACLAATGTILTSAHLGYLDWVIGLSYLFYSIALLVLWMRGTNHLSRARIELADGLRRWILAAAGLLVAFLIGDTAIAISFALQRSEYALSMISYGAVVMIGVLLITIVTISAGAAKRPKRSAGVTVESDGSEELERRVRSLLLETRLYLDTDLTVDRLARRLRVPARTLSIAINQCKGVNVSQYVNDFRLAHAADLLATGDESVVSVMEQSGFLTRSNFYREFDRKYGQSPAAYREAMRPPT